MAYSKAPVTGRFEGPKDGIPVKMNRILKSILVLLLTAVLTAGAVFMVGPQIMVIVPAAVVAGIVFAVRRSCLSLVCFGYPFTFGLISAVIGYREMPDYARTPGFAVSIGLGLVGVGLIAAGLWKALDTTPRKANGAAEPAAPAT